MRRLAVLWIAVCLPLAAQFDSDLAPRELERGEGEGLPFGIPEPPEGTEVDHSPLLMRELRTIVLRGNGDGGIQRTTISSTAKSVGIHAEGISQDAGPALGEALSSWLGRPLTERGLDLLTDTILAVYQEHDRPVVDVAVPDQDLTAGQLEIEITEGRIGAVGMGRTRYFDDELLGGAIHLEEGELLTTSLLQEQLDWLNRNPFRPASVFAAPGTGIGEADFVFTFDERRPWRFYTGYENSGTEDAGEHRFFAGFNWGNAFGLDHLLSYQVTVGDSLDQFHAHSLAWEIPLHQLHRFIRIDATWADVEAESSSAGTAINAEGETFAMSAAYGMPLPRRGDLTHELLVGVEFKTTDNFLTFGDNSLPGEDVEIVQARVDYRASMRGEKSAFTANAALVASPGGLTGRNDDDSFDAFRAGAQSDYVYVKGEFTWVRRLAEDWSLRVSAEGQLASGKLLAIEQLDFGGHATVRGYTEREYLADSGYVVSTEVRAPAIGLVVHPLPISQFQLLAFLDHGTGWRDDDGSNSFTGAGAGIRLQAEDFGEVRFDIGWPLGDSGGPEAHAGVFLSF